MFISCPKISIFLVKTTRETASAELVPSLQFVQNLAQVPSVYRLRSVLIGQKSPPSGHLEKSVSPNPDPWDHLIDQIPTLCPTPPPPPPLGVNIDRCIIPMRSTIPAMGDIVYRKCPIFKPRLLVSLMGTIHFLNFS